MKKPKIPKNKRPVATEKHPNIAAILEGTFAFPKEQQAVNKLKELSRNFMTSTKLPIPEKDNTLNLWIRGYRISEDEEEEGYLGNYAHIYVKKFKDDEFSIRAHKLEVKLRFHPQKARKVFKYPNLWHPVFRSAKNKKIFDTIEEARENLQKFHKEYPEVSIPLTNKIYIMVWENDKEKESPVEKYVVEIKILKEGGFYFESKINDYKPTDLPIAKTEKQKKAMGFFTSMVGIKSKKKD